jgi:predicted dehydrogenase
MLLVGFGEAVDNALTAARHGEAFGNCGRKPEEVDGSSREEARSMESLSRRDFLKSTSAVATGLFAGASLLAGGRRAVAADEEIRAAVIGLNGRGGAHIGGLLRIPGVRITALCDPDESLFESRAQGIADKQGAKPRCYYDIRELLEDDQVDVVTIATPNHWHALATIWACQAGKDVYVEKPASWGIFEGQQMVKAARKYGRIVQNGTQSRSEGGKRHAVARLYAGDIGKVYMARSLCFKTRRSIGFKPPMDPPASLHWNLWRGPAPEQPYHENLVHYNWHWFWDFGNGDYGNQGVHQADVARWGLAKGLPTYVHSRGGRLGYEDQGETPNTQVAEYQYDDGTMLVMEVRGLPSNDEAGIRIGNSFYGSEGWMTEGDDWKVHLGYEGTVQEEAPDRELPDVGGAGPDDPFANWIKAVRSRKVADLNAEVEEGVQSAALCHLAMTSYRLRRALSFDAVKEEYVDDDEANSYLRRRAEGRRMPREFEIPEKV